MEEEHELFDLGYDVIEQNLKWKEIEAEVSSKVRYLQPVHKSRYDFGLDFG